MRDGSGRDLQRGQKTVAAILQLYLLFVHGAFFSGFISTRHNQGYEKFTQWKAKSRDAQYCNARWHVSDPFFAFPVTVPCDADAENKLSCNPKDLPIALAWDARNFWGPGPLSRFRPSFYNFSGYQMSLFLSTVFASHGRKKSAKVVCLFQVPWLCSNSEFQFGFPVAKINNRIPITPNSFFTSAY